MVENLLNLGVSSLRHPQHILLERVDHGQISRGATVPEELIFEYLKKFENSLVLGAGCGIGDKEHSFWSLGEGKIRVVGVDINQRAVGQAIVSYGKETGLDYLGDDVTDLEFDSGVFQAVVGNGLLCNLVFNQETGKDDLETTLGEFSRILQPGGYLFLADCLRTDDPQAKELISLDSQVEKLPPGWDFYYWKNSWDYRYSQNEELGLKNGTFWVMSLGEGKELEFGDTNQLVNLISEDRVERLARHYDEKVLQDLITNSGFSQCHWEKVVWRSRTNEPLIGVVAVFKKE